MFMRRSKKSGTQFTHPVSYDLNPFSPVFHHISQRLESLKSVPQWILITAECPRPEMALLLSSQLCQKTIQLRPSRCMNEYEVVMKAIRSGNACAIMASGHFSSQQQASLNRLSRQHQCEVFFAHSTCQSLH
ncbi:hypothetical protein [Vibrio aerogenes]|uniref:hypothetical protein n=1 Tax=Vibrio aerogenes TaxID=92172 RepID=UPI0039F0D647